MGFFIRIYGINWDQNQHLHPDERFLTMVGGAVSLPKSINQYLDPQISPLNPYNVNYGFFVYGTLPLTLNKIAATLVHMDNYNDFAILGRVVSAIFDTGVIILVFLLALLFEKKYKLNKNLKYLAAFFYALSVLPIQHAHFFVSESFLNFFMIASFYFTFRFLNQKKSVSNLLISAILFGLAIGTKISAIYILPLILCIVIYKDLNKKTWMGSVMSIFIFIGIAYITLRFADPKFFANANFLDPSLNPTFIQNIKELTTLANRNALYFPPAVQWFDKKPVIFALTNIAFFGLGIPLFILATLGFIIFTKIKKIEVWAIIIWILVFFLYQSTRFTPSMRYFIFLYPFLAIFAAMGFLLILDRTDKTYRTNWSYKRIVGLVIFFLVLVWPLSFMSIYSRPHSRVEASYWINKNIPEGAFLAEEHWDDWLPVGLPDIVNKVYTGEQMPVFAPDTPEKWGPMEKTLKKADYLIFTSNRGYGSMMPQPKMYPKMSKFYQDLFAGKSNFKKIKEFTSYPTLLPLYILHNTYFMFDDQWSEEAFTVYDHPKVTIFKKRS